MGLLDSILGTASGKTDASGEANPLIGILGGLLAQSGGLQGLANKFSQSGCGGVFASWVGMGENQSISSDQIQKALGSQQVQALAAKMGIDPAQASNLLAEFLPKVVDKLTPTGQVDPTADHQQGLAAIIAHITRSKTGRVISGRLLSEKCGRGFSGIIREHRRDRARRFSADEIREAAFRLQLIGWPERRR